MATYGRNRQSIIDIEEQLKKIFQKHPKSQPNESGEPVIPGNALVDVFRAFSDICDGVELMTNEEMDMLKDLLASNPGLEVTPQILLQFIAARSKHSPRGSPANSPYESDASSASHDRGRARDRLDSDDAARSSSSDSAEHREYNVHSPSRGPSTPLSANGASPFDASKRQRSAPLGPHAPSSWRPNRVTPQRRRRSDSSQYASDSEHPPSSYGVFRTPSRQRAPSNPVSPRSSSQPELSATSPTSRPHSRAHSRGHSQPQYPNFASAMYDTPASPPFHGSPSPIDHSFDEDFTATISSLTMPRSDTDSDGENPTLGLVFDRSAHSSTASLEPLERLEALQRANMELDRKLREAERTLLRKATEHEQEMEELQSRYDESKSELASTKREEKELRVKERQYMTQISALESEIAKLQKSLDNARAAYQSLQKQYQEQCAESERYRNSLRLRDQEIKDHKETAALQHIEGQKWGRERDSYEDRIAHLEAELSIAQQAVAHLDEQKQETLMLKETIDRMRYDMDEMRSNASAFDKSGSSGTVSVVGSVSKSLGAELAGKMKGMQWSLDEDDLDTETVQKNLTLSVAEGIEPEGEMTEGEDVVETVITRRKRKVASRANRIETHRFEEVKEYSDAYTQHEARDFTSSASMQTAPELKVVTDSISVQTEVVPEPARAQRVTCDVDVQTETGTSQPMTGAATTSLTPTVVTPISTATDEHPPADQPPAYDQAEGDWRQLADVLKKWHKGADLPLLGVPGGVSEEALQGWKTLQEEVGVGCVVMEKIIEKSGKRPRERRTASGSGNKGRFYNIYNTYVYGSRGSRDGADGGAPSSFTPALHALMCAGASAFMVLLMGPYVVPYYNIPGSATYYDRSAWASFNSMQAVGEGFAADGTNAVWSFLGTVGGGAARIVRGWPT